MTITAPPALTPTPMPVPQRNDRATFGGRYDAHITWQSISVAEYSAVTTNVYNNAVEAYNAALVAASASATAISAAGVTMWVSGTTYAAGVSTISLLNLQSYRRRTTGAGTTDPSLDPTNWARVTIDGMGTIGSMVTGNTTLTSSSAGYQPIAMTAPGKAITAPDATALSLGGPKYLLDNSAGGYSIGWRDSTGVLAGRHCVPAGGMAEVWLEDNSTAAGVWRLKGDNLEAGLVTGDNTLSASYLSSIFAPFVSLADDVSIHFAPLAAGGFAAFLVDKNSTALSTPVTVSASSGDVPRTAFKIDATHALVFFSGAASTGKAVVLSLTGSSGAYGLTVNAAATSAQDTTNWGGENFSSAPKVVQLSSALYLAAFVTGTTAYCESITVSGVTTAIGAAFTVLATTANGIGNVMPVSATSAAILYNDGTSSPYNIKSDLISVSGSTCSRVGTAQTVSSVMNGVATGYYSSCLLSTTLALCLDCDSSFNVRAIPITIGGGGTSVGTPVSVETGIGVNGISYGANGATRYNPHLSPLSSSTALLWYFDSSNISRAVVITSAPAITVGAIAYRSISAAAVNTAGGGAILPQGTTEFVAAVAKAGSASGYSFNYTFRPHKISGTTITWGGSGVYSKLVAQQDTIGATRLPSGKYIFAGCNSANSSDSMEVFSSNGDAINYSGDIKIPLFGSSSVVPTVVGANRIVMLGQQTGAYGLSTPALRVLNIEIPI
ncbi:MAG: hypothetical protein V4724_26470 [Pseudomonadota bacterium]